MGKTPRVKSLEGVRRLSTFADAVVAIAMTLLVLPLVDLPSESTSSLGSLLSDHAGQIGAFFLSFLVIARLWQFHHTLFESVISYDNALVQLTLLWLLTVVFLPFPTEITGTHTGRAVSALYIGTLLASSVALGVTSVWLHRHPALTEGEIGHRANYTPWAFPALLSAAGLLAVGFPRIGLWALLLLLATRPVEKLMARLRSHPSG